MAPAFFAKASRRADFLIPFGGDVASFPMRTPLKLRKLGRTLHDWKVASLQAQGIRQAKAILTEVDIYGKYIAKLDFKGRLIDSHFPMVYDYTERLRSDSDVRGSEFAQRVDALRAQSDFIVFHHARHIWKTQITAQEIAGALTLLYRDPIKRRELGEANYRWYRQKFVGNFFDAFWSTLDS